MSWRMLPEPVREIAERELTEKQLQVFKLELAGFSDGAIALALNLSRSSVRDRRASAYRRLRNAGVRQDGSGYWYFEPPVFACNPDESGGLA